ncbi:MAG: phosphoribosyltransferase [Firmicutes bacterium]|nr:phosphoribosyltransferase [Bacillota bacterium]
MLFSNRAEAGRQLARELTPYKGRAPLLLAVPRGGVPLAYEIQRVLGGRLDLVIPRKIPAPHHSELALGAVAQDGSLVLNEDILARLKVPQDYIAAEVSRQLREIERRLACYRGERPYPSLRGQTVIIIDDGVATGATLRAALKMVREKKAQRLILAVPVGPAKTIATLRALVDELVCLATPEVFYAVGQFYADFGQVEDGEVRELLKKAWRETGDLA